MMDTTLRHAAVEVQKLAGFFLDRGIFLSTAESCTGGLVGHLLTNEPGSSSWYRGGVVAYSNELKVSLLGVSRKSLEEHGAVSSHCVLNMVRGVCRLTGSEAGIAVSGIAGPGGGTLHKPVGTVYIGWGLCNEFWWAKSDFSGNRQEIKNLSALKAITGLSSCFSGRR